MNRKDSIVLVLSGGQDSTTILFMALAEGRNVHAVSIDYGQRHVVEVEAARKVVEVANRHYPKIGVTHEQITLGPVLTALSPLVSDNPLEQYENWGVLPGGIEKTFVPLRNQLFLTLAINRAVARDCKQIWTGLSQEDYGGYPDCRRSFIDQFVHSTNLGLQGVARVRVVTPLMDKSKRQTVLIAAGIKGCFEALSYSHTAYDGAYPPVGHDHATLLRAKGFFEAGFPDPLVVRAWREGRMDLPETSNYDEEREQYRRIVAEREENRV